MQSTSDCSKNQEARIASPGGFIHQRDDNLGVRVAQLDLANVAAGAFNLLSDHSCARQASADLALRDVTDFG